jgi:hypothetical protein
MFYSDILYITTYSHTPLFRWYRAFYIANKEDSPGSSCLPVLSQCVLLYVNIFFRLVTCFTVYSFLRPLWTVLGNGALPIFENISEKTCRCGWDLAQWLERLTGNVEVLLVLPASSNTVKSEGGRWSIVKNSTYMWRIRDVYPGSWFLPIPDLGSRIQNQQQKRGVKKICCHNFLCSHNFHKMAHYFSFDVLKKKIWVNLQRIIELFTQKIVIKLSKI